MAPDPRYPPTSRPASDFERPGRRSAARLAAFEKGRSRVSCLPGDLPPGPVDVLCLRPLHHVLEYEALYGFLAALRSGGGGDWAGGDADGAGGAGRRRRGRLFLSSALAGASPFARLPAADI